MSFKKLGEYTPATRQVDPNCINGGVPLNGRTESPNYSVRHPDFRLRRIDQQDTAANLSNIDIDPIKLHPGNISEIEIPDASEVKKGVEQEFWVIDQDGDPVDLYSEDGEWLLDRLGLHPEALRWQGEIATKPVRSFDDIEQALLDELEPIINRLDELNLLLFPGDPSYPLNRDWDNASAHPYIMRIHDSLKLTALDFGSCTVQTHTDLEPFGGTIELGLMGGNAMNPTYTTMLNTITTASPFNNGRITAQQSNRENRRRKLATKGGYVSYDYPVDGWGMLEKGDRAIRNGETPVPERALGSHGDIRPAKLTTGTIEVGPGDMQGNPDYAATQAVLTTHFMVRVAEAAKNGEEIPSFLLDNNGRQRRINRDRASEDGHRARLSVQNGRRKNIPVAELWDDFLEWIRPEATYDRSFHQAEQTIRRMLVDPTPAAQYGERAFEQYFNRGGENYLRGNIADVMRAYAQCMPGDEINKIRATNVEYAKRYMADIRARIPEKTVR